MKQFKMLLNLSCYDTLEAFMEVEKPGKDDLILTTKPIYANYIKKTNADCHILLFEDYGQGEPTTAMIDRIRTDLPKPLGRIIAIGGGSVMDTAKILSLETGGNTEEIFLGKCAVKRGYDVIAIPTTCGTGSEVTNACACELLSLKTKRGLSLEEFYPAKSVLIPELIKGLPYQVFATSSIDALIHAIESYLSPKANPHTEIFSREAIGMIVKGYCYTLEKGKDKWSDLAEEFIIASNFAGIAFANAGCAAVHALSYPLGGLYHIPHGEANQLMLPGVMRKYKAKQPVGRLNLLEELFAELLGTSKEESLEKALELCDSILPRKSLREYGIDDKEFPGFTEGVIDGQQRLLGNNYVELSFDDILEIYKMSY